MLVRSLKSGGFSLVELIVSIALTVTLLTGVIAIFVSARSSYASTDRLSQIQQSGRSALDRLTYDIRSAGFSGCARYPLIVDNALNTSEDSRWNFRGAPVYGYDSDTRGSLQPDLDVRWIPNASGDSDVLLVRGPRRGAVPLRLVTSMAGGGDELVVRDAASSTLKAGDVAIAYNCEATVYFQVSSFVNGVIAHAGSAPNDGLPGNSSDEFAYLLQNGAQILPLETTVYYVGTNRAGAKGLWRRIGADKPKELVAGVEQMQLQFRIFSGEEVSSSGDYLRADAVPDWNNVDSVAISLLVSSLDPVASDAETPPLQLLDVLVPASTDKHIREVFSAVAGVRNRTYRD